MEVKGHQFFIFRGPCISIYSYNKNQTRCTISQIYFGIDLYIWAGHVARMGEERAVYRVLVGKPEGKRQLGRPRRRWVNNIRMDLQEVGCGYMDWIGACPG